ncbi:MAG: cation:proton antiporter [Cyanobacteria bacterium]|nr:cation:proton antiporter [Cyanobacteria bacterium bin.275]
MSSSLQALLVVAFLTAGLPFAARPLRGRVPTIILYLISGIVVGPALLGWIQPDPAMDLLRKLALAAVFAGVWPGPGTGPGDSAQCQCLAQYEVRSSGLR